MARRIVYHREAILADHPCDAGREEGLAQPRCAEQQQILPPRTEAVSYPHLKAAHPEYAPLLLTMNDLEDADWENNWKQV